MQNLEDMCKKYVNDVYWYLFCITHNKEISEDITQETMYKAIKNINQFKGKCKINVWLCKIAKNELRMYNNKEKRIQYIPIDEAITVASGVNIEDNIIDKMYDENLYKAIQKLGDEIAQIMFLRLENDMSFQEIGEIFDKNESWARVKFFRGKEKVKEMLRNEQTKQTM